MFYKTVIGRLNFIRLVFQHKYELFTQRGLLLAEIIWKSGTLEHWDYPTELVLIKTLK